MLHAIGCILLLGLHLSFVASAWAVPMHNWNTTVSSLPVSTKVPCQSLTVPLHSTFVSSAQRYSQSESTDDYAPQGLQSALYTARPSGAITSLAISPPYVRVEPQSCSVFGAHPSDLVPGGSSGLLSRHASVISSQLPTGTGRLLPATTSAITQSTTGPGNLLVAVGQFDTVSISASVLSTGLGSAMSAPPPTETSQNALSVLLAALPSDVASSIEAGFSVVTQELFATSEVVTSDIATRPSPSLPTGSTIISTSRSEPTLPSSRQSERPSSRYTARPTTEQPPSSRPTSHPIPQHTFSRTSHPASNPISRTTEQSETHKPSTFLTLPLTTSTTSQSSTTTPTSLDPGSTLAAEKSKPTTPPAKQQANGTIAGVATGAAAGIVLITLAIFFFLRRHQRRRALKAVEAKASQPYPESAWLYDPVRSPPRSQSPAPQLPEIPGVGGVAGMTPAQAKRSSMLAPEVVMPEGEPLLAPSRAATRDSSPAGNGRGRSASPGVEAR